MGQYPAGLTQAGFDRAFDDLGPDYLTCEECDETPEPPEPPEPPDPADYISKHDAATILRVMLRLQEQVEAADREKRHTDALSLCKTIGKLLYLQTEVGIYNELGA